MNFENLNLAINGYKDAAPTLFQVICTVKSLFDDIEENYGLEVCECEAGNDSVTTELYWLCSQILEIYGAQKELLSSRPRVEEALKKLEPLRAELKGSADMAEELKALEEEYQRLQDARLARETMQARWSALNEEIQKAKQQLQEQHCFDFVTAEKELKSLQDEIAKLQTENGKLTQELENARRDRDGLSRMILDKKDELERLKLQIEEMKKVLAECQVRLAEGKQEKEQLAEAVDNAHQDVAKLEKQIAGLQDQVDAYEAQELEPLRAKQRELQRTVDDLERQRRDLEQSYNDNAEQRDQLVMSISRQKTANESMKETVQTNQQKLTQLEDKAEQLEKEVNGLVAQLAMTQGEVEQLENQKLPETQKLLSDEESRRDKWNEEIRRLTEEKEQLSGENYALEQKLPALQSQHAALTQKLEATQQVYNEITINVTTGNAELKKLEENIAEIKSEKPEENYLLYRNQLLEEKRKLEEDAEKLRAVKLEMQELQVKLDQEKDKLEKEQAKKEQYEMDYAKVRSLRQKLEPTVGEGNVRRLEEVAQQLRLLETVRNKLAGSVELLHQNLKDEAFEDKWSLDDRFQVTLQALQRRTDELRKDLLNCADTLKNATKI